MAITMKTLYTVSEAAKMLEISPDTLRLWDKQGIAHALRTPTNQRRFTLEEIERLKAKPAEARDALVTRS